MSDALDRAARALFDAVSLMEPDDPEYDLDWDDIPEDRRAEWRNVAAAALGVMAVDLREQIRIAGRSVLYEEFASDYRNGMVTAFAMITSILFRYVGGEGDDD